HLIVLHKIVGVFMADGNAVAAIVFENVFFKQTMAHAPAQEQTILTVIPRQATSHDWPLGPAARMHPQSAVILADTILNQHVVGLLETDPVAIEIPHYATPNYCAEAAVQENAASTAAIERDVLLFVSVNHQVLDSRSFQIVSADHGKHRRGFGAVGHQTIRVQRLIKRKGVPVPAGDPAHSSMETARLAVPNRKAVADFKPSRVLHG